MTLSISLANETFTLDESAGIQNGADGTPSGSARADSDISLATLQTQAAAFYDYLYGGGAGQLGLSSTFTASVGAAASSTSLINVQDSGGGTISTIGFTDADGDSFDGTQSSGLSTADGDHAIYLVGGLNDQVVLGMYDSDNNGSLDAVAFAVYMKPDGTLDSNVNLQLFTATFTALEHNTDSNTAAAYDDALDLLQNVYVNATGELHINFDNMPSGSNLFNDAAESASGGGIIVIGKNPVTGTDGKYTNTSDVITTSQGGDGATIGVNSQMFDPNEGAYFTYVRDILDTYLSGAKGGLSPTEADYEQNMQYAELIEARTASIHISQIQNANDLAGMKLTAFELDDAYQGADLLDNLGDPGDAPVVIDHVWVYDENHVLLEDSASPDNSNAITITLNGDGTANLTGLNSGYIIEWHTAADHNQVLIESTAGKFDVGGFDIREGSSQIASLAGHSYVEDDGPSFSAPIADGLVDFTSGDSDTHTLNGVPGSDTPGTYEISSYTTSLDILGVHLDTTINTGKTEVKYYEDKDGSGTLNTGDILYYTLSLTPAGSYTFTVNNAPAAPPLQFDFDDLPSGSNLFGAVADTPDGSGLFVFGRDTDLNSSTTKYTNSSDVIHTSQGGIGATIGVNNQMFDAGEGAYFTFVDDIVDNYLAGATGGLTATEADYGKNLQYDDGLHETSGAFMGISQIQAGSTAALTLTAFLIDPNTAPQGVNLINASGDPSDAVDILSVSVYAGSIGGTLLESFSSGSEANITDSITITIGGEGVAHVSGLDAGMVVAWTTDGDHNQVLLEATGGKFDVGFFGFSEDQVIPDQLLDFTVKLTDSDGDYAEDSFQVGVDGDLDGNITNPVTSLSALNAASLSDTTTTSALKVEALNYLHTPDYYMV